MPTVAISQSQRMIALIQKAHNSQTRLAGRVPYWPHCLNVAELIKEAVSFHTNSEIDADLLFDIYLAALGHDLYEDTTVTREQIRGKFGDTVDGLIWWLTNEQSDTNRQAYVEKMRKAPEAARLIKLADIVDNTLTVAYGLEDLGDEWATAFFRPIVKEMLPAVLATSFTQFSQASQWLGAQATFAIERLNQQLRRTYERRILQ